MSDLSERMEQKEKEAREAQRTELEKVTAKIGDLTRANDERQEKLREALNENMATLRRENEAKLEQMRVTVDEKLQGTLDQRLGESFKLVGDRLESVQKGLGEMQQLAAGVGDLKRVLTNVKSRGAWGEVQLGALLEDMLTPDQYAAQVRIQPDRGEVVDYVVHLPGASDAGRVLLPIDCKFPHEDYDRLLAAQEAGDPVAVEIAAKALERAVRVQAKSINEKYVHPPASTNFAIMYLPTEGLFAEVVRRPGLVADLQQAFRVTVTGPDHACGPAEQPAHGLHHPGDPEALERGLDRAGGGQEGLPRLWRGLRRGRQEAGRGQEEGGRGGREAPRRQPQAARRGVAGGP
jgi:DNA recombination protein RmuC